MKVKFKKFLSYLMFAIMIGLIFHFLFNYIKTPDTTALTVIKKFLPRYIAGSISLMIYFIWGNTVQDF